MPSEVRTILKQMGVDDAKRKPVDFTLKEAVRVTDGPFANIVGSIEEIDADRAKLKVLVSMFGRETPLELDFDQVEKL
jgi:transcriptional antiterminator NusG